MTVCISLILFSSPFRSFYLSIIYNHRKGVGGQRSRPLFGVSIFLPYVDDVYDVKSKFSSPFRGFYLSTDLWDGTVKETKEFSSPFRGFYLWC